MRDENVVLDGEMYIQYINSLKEKYKDNEPETYHHIRPRAYGGNDKDKDNLCPCNSHEHEVLHWLLWRYNRESRKVKNDVWRLYHNLKTANKVKKNK